jgi:hypothetical protein
MGTVEYQNLIQRLKIFFPNLEPITNTPPLLLVRGIGLAMAGRRDAHPTTSSYIKTLSFVILWIVPLFRIRCYRVLDAAAFGREFNLLSLQAPRDDKEAIARYCKRKGDWHFIGREPLSTFEISWNLGVAVLLIGWLWLLTKA